MVCIHIKLLIYSDNNINNDACNVKQFIEIHIQVMKRRTAACGRASLHESGREFRKLKRAVINDTGIGIALYKSDDRQIVEAGVEHAIFINHVASFIIFEKKYRIHPMSDII
jgi:hypothetical protein